MICISCGETFTATNRNVVCAACRELHIESHGYLNGATNITLDEAKEARDRIKLELECFEMLVSGKELHEIAAHSNMTKQQLCVLFRRKVNNLYPKGNRAQTETYRKSYDFTLTWPESLYAAVFQLELYEHMPDDAEESVNSVLNDLSDKEQRILRFRYQDGMTLADVGKEENLTRERVRQIESKALKKLRYPGKLSCLKFGLRDTQRMLAIDQEAKMAVLAEQEQRIREAAIAKYEAHITQAVILQETNLYNLNLCTRSHNALKRAGMLTLRDIESHKDEIRHIRNLGEKSYREIKERCEEFGIALP